MFFGAGFILFVSNGSGYFNIVTNQRIDMGSINTNIATTNLDIDNVSLTGDVNLVYEGSFK